MARIEPRVGRWLCIAAAAIGSIALVGWLVRAPILTTFPKGGIPIVPNTALALTLLGAAGALRWREDVPRAQKAFAIVLGVVAVAVGGGTIDEYLFGVNLGIDELLVPAPVGPYPGRPSPLTAIAVILLAGAILLFDVRPNRRARPSEWLALGAGLTASIGLIGLLFGAGPIYRLPSAPVIGLALPTAVGLLCLTMGLLLERPSAGFMAVATSRASGGMMLRRLLPVSIIAPVLLGLATMTISRAWGIGELPLVLAAFASAMIIVSLSKLTIIAAPLNRTHVALEASRARVQSLFDQAPDGLFIANLEGKYTDVNEAGCRLLGRTRDDIVGKTIMDLIPPEDVARLEQARTQLLAGGTQVAEWKLRHADGHWVPTEVNARILPDGRWQGFVRDLTERTRLERAKRLFADVGAVLGSQLAYQEALQSVARLVVRDYAAVCVIDLVEEDGSHHRTSAASREDVTPVCHALRLDHGQPSLVPKLSRAQRETLASNDACLRALEDMDIASVITVPLSSRGKVLGTVVLLATSASHAYDAEDLRITNELARRVALAIDNARLYAAAQRAIQARDEVLGIVAHDLRNPLGVILMQAGVLRNEREATDVIKRAANRMDRLIRDLLDVTRMESGRLTIERARVPVGQVVTDIVEVQRPLVAAKGLELRVEVPRDLPVVWGDRHRLMQVFENLIGNAMKFSPRGSTITVGAAARERDVLFWVKDTGVGISPEDQAHVFDRFWQAHGDAARQGAGLGLQIVKGLVEAHDGRAWVESDLGHGTTFFFTIPAETIRAAAGFHHPAAG